MTQCYDTALMKAARCGNQEMIKLLLDSGADKNLKNKVRYILTVAVSNFLYMIASIFSTLIIGRIDSMGLASYAFTIYWYVLLTY